MSRMSGIQIEQINEAWIIHNADRLWNWLGAEKARAELAAQREARAEERHRELLLAIEKSTDTLVKAIDGGFRMLADTLPR